ncbi:MAG: Rpn family recombination-promoting nuclease/putative transposase, partial [Saprospiraceae bacterium]|nr:Rpn family recombination-promoting nuclease/putative transposase [Saprospiraceae bacterium]
MAKSKPKGSRKKDKPHDAVFKAFFGDVGIVRNYLAHYTSPEVYGHIDLAALRKCDTAFVGGRFGVSFSDMVYETRLNTGAPVRLLFLFEHKSYEPDHP